MIDLIKLKVITINYIDKSTQLTLTLIGNELAIYLLNTYSLG